MKYLRSSAIALAAGGVFVGLCAAIVMGIIAVKNLYGVAPAFAIILCLVWLLVAAFLRAADPTRR